MASILETMLMMEWSISIIADAVSAYDCPYNLHLSAPIPFRSKTYVSIAPQTRHSILLAASRHQSRDRGNIARL